MKITKDKELLEYIDSLIDINNLNMSISDMMSEIVGNQHIVNKNEVTTLMNKFHSKAVDILCDKYTTELDIDLSNEEDEDIFNYYVKERIHELNSQEYTSNPFYQCVKVSHIKDGDYEIVMDKYLPYELFAYKDMEIDEDFGELNSFGFFLEEFPFLAINYKGVTWMSINPNEIETMKDSLSRVKGNVLVLGLGLGYYPFMAALKDEVKTITVIEKDKHIIDIFNKHLFPLFKNKEKIKVINMDAFEYIKNNSNYDYAFIDLWHDPYDGIELYLKAKRLERSDKEYHYWLESSMYALLRRCFISLLEEQLAGYKEDNYKTSKSITDTIINKFYEQTKKIDLKSVSQLKELLSDQSLLNLLI